MNAIDTAGYMKSLQLSHPLREPIVGEIIQSMQLPESGCGLDVGCGIGLNTIMLAQALGSEGRVVGLDNEEEFLMKARGMVDHSAVRERIRLERGEALNLPFPDQFFDWACSIDCVGVLPLEPLLLLRELRRVVKPGGKVFIAVWSSQMLLPGFPLLEASLNASPAGIAPFAEGMPPENHTLRALGWFRQAGLSDHQARTFVRDIYPPLSNEIVAAMADLFTMRWGSNENKVSNADWLDYQRLCQPDSPDFILRNTDYYAFFTYSVFSGRV